MVTEKYLCLATLASDLISLFPSNGFVPEISLGLSIRVLTRRGKTSLLHNTVTHCFIIAIAAISSSDEINCRCWRCLTRFLTVSSCFFPKKKLGFLFGFWTSMHNKKELLLKSYYFGFYHPSIFSFRYQVFFFHIKKRKENENVLIYTLGLVMHIDTQTERVS